MISAFKFSLGMVVVLSLWVLAGCGGGNKNTTGCNETKPQVGKHVAYMGYRSEDKFRENVDYVGKVLNVLADGYAEVEWLNATMGKTSVHEGSVKAENVCTPTKVEKRVLYSGYRDGKEFKENNDYFGNIVTTFTDNYYQVKWDHLPDEIHVQHGGSLKIQE